MQFDLSLSQEQIQTLSAAQIQSLQLLAMDNFELRQMMQAEYLENPLLEYERRSSFSPIGKGYVGEDEKRRELSDKEQSLQSFITGQLNIKKYSKKEWAVIKFLIANLDEQGFFGAEPGEMAVMNGVAEETVLRLLEDLRQLEPRGLFAKDVRQCLLTQLPDGEMLARQLVEHYLEELSRGEVSALARKLGVSSSQVRRAMETISRLNPRPLNGLDTSSTHYVIPDLLLTPDPVTGKLEASLNDDWSADYRLSDYYLSMIRSVQDPQLQEYFKQKHQRARMLIEGIEQRRKTLLAIGNFLGREQEQFLLGKGKKVSLTMTGAAAALELSVSTISRAVKGKYVQHPAGCTALKDLFVTPVAKAAPSELSRDAIKGAIKVLVEGEDKHNPYSDAELVEKLGEQEIFISRRTVAKYRESLGIPGCFDRRRYDED